MVHVPPSLMGMMATPGRPLLVPARDGQPAALGAARFRAFRPSPVTVARVAAAALVVPPPLRQPPAIQRETLPSPIVDTRAGLGRRMLDGPHVSGGFPDSNSGPSAGSNQDSGPLALGRPLGHALALDPSPTTHSPLAPPPQLPSPVVSLLLALPDSMAREAGDGGPRPKRRAEGREERRSAEPWHPSPDA